MFKGNKYSIIFITHISSFFRFLVLSTSTVRMSEGTFCRVEVHIVKYSEQVHIEFGIINFEKRFLNFIVDTMN